MDLNVKETNKKLRDLYGIDSVGKPFYRLVRAGDLREPREGEFSEFYGEILVRRWIGVNKEAEKYSYIPHDVWILEQACVDCTNDTDDYEPLWCFMDGNKKPLDPTWRFIEILVWAHRNPSKITDGITEQDMFDANVRHFFDVLEQESTDFMNQIRAQEAIFLPGKDF